MMTLGMLYANRKDQFSIKDIMYLFLAGVGFVILGILFSLDAESTTIFDVLKLSVITNKGTLGAVSVGYSLLIVSLLQTLYVSFRKIIRK